VFVTPRGISPHFFRLPFFNPPVQMGHPKSPGFVRFVTKWGVRCVGAGLLLASYDSVIPAPQGFFPPLFQTASFVTL